MTQAEQHMRSILKSELEKVLRTEVTIGNVRSTSTTKKCVDYQVDISYELERSRRTETLNVRTYTRHPHIPHEINGKITEAGKRADENVDDITSDDFDQNMS